MPKKTIQQFSVDRLSILDPQGEMDPSFASSFAPPTLKQMFKNMLQVRLFDEKAIRMQRQGRMGTFAASTGQEATHIGSAMAMDSEDWAVPCFREQGVYLNRGIKASTLFLFYMGSEEGNRISKDKHILPFCVPCATQVLHAVGIGMAAKIKQDPIAVVTYLGDGATSEGDFHEALNFASVLNTPVVFLCQNNHWAISTPPERQYHSPTLAQRALAYGMKGLQVDGNDVLAVYQATRDALDQAKSGQGPTFLECETYRLCPHTTNDDPNRYQNPSELEQWKHLDPMLRLEKYLLNQNLLSPEEKEAMSLEIEAHLKQQAEEAEEICSRLDPTEMFTYLFNKMPDILKGQQEEILRLTSEKEEGVIHA
ncbi:MAG: pyruvate dehydrogenase (acetyl-transferring) E1 component subunit alpha [bacterium]|nr:pyruvate dehydrogenase (acetyl-transferring) E1 component subunit alpha [bacterium]